jgi:hypothetical protein
MRRIVLQLRTYLGRVFPGRLGLDSVSNGLLLNVAAEPGSELFEESAKAKAVRPLVGARHHRAKLVDLIAMGFTRWALGWEIGHVRLDAATGAKFAASSGTEGTAA